MSHIIYQRRHRCCRSIPSHQFAAVPCSQHRHILIYPNVLHTNNPSQFANRANHPIALTLPAIQGGPFLLDGSWRQVSHFANDTHTDGYSKVSNDPSADLEGKANAVYVTLFYRSNDRSASAVKTPSKRNAVTRGASPLHPSLYCGEELRNDEGTSRYVVLMTRNRDGIVENIKRYRRVGLFPSIDRFVISNLSSLSFHLVEFFAPLREISSNKDETQ